MESVLHEIRALMEKLGVLGAVSVYDINSGTIHVYAHVAGLFGLFKKGKMKAFESVLSAQFPMAHLFWE